MHETGDYQRRLYIFIFKAILVHRNKLLSLVPAASFALVGKSHKPDFVQSLSIFLGRLLPCFLVYLCLSREQYGF